MARSTDAAHRILAGWKGDDYAFGTDVLGNTGGFARSFGIKALLVVADLGAEWVRPLYDAVKASLDEAGVCYAPIVGAGPNAPREDVYPIANEISKLDPDCIVAVGGGSTIDAAKCAAVLSAYSVNQVRDVLGAGAASASTVEPFFGMGNVTKLREATGIAPTPVVAVQTIASSGAHLTKYSNVTDPVAGQKKLIIDMAIVPAKAVFDYGITIGAPKGLTLDGGLDGIAHLWEVFMGATGQPHYDRAKEIAVEGIALIVDSLPAAMKNPRDLDARSALGYGTDLGGYAIMIGGTNGGHLGSFSLVDVLTHGRACAVLNPYYTVLFAEAIRDQLRTVGKVYRDAGYIAGSVNFDALSGRALAETVAKGMIAFSKAIDFPTTLGEAGATHDHIERMFGEGETAILRLTDIIRELGHSPGNDTTVVHAALRASNRGSFR